MPICIMNLSIKLVHDRKRVYKIIDDLYSFGLQGSENKTSQNLTYITINIT